MTRVDDATFERLIDDLHYRYEDTFDRAEVADVVARARAEMEPTSRHPEFLPVLVEHYTRDHLLARARADGRVARATAEILFVCVHNEGRSQMAAALARHLSEGHVHVRSAGLHPTGRLNPTVVEALRERGVDLDHPYPTGLADDIVHAADVVVRMGCEVPGLAGRRDLDWDVADPHDRDLDDVRAIRDDLERRIVALLHDLDVPVRPDALPAESAPHGARHHHHHLRIPGRTKLGHA